MKQKLLSAFLILYIGGAFVDYLHREGIKNGLWDKILWRDGFLPVISLTKGLLWPLHLISDTPSTKIYTQSSKSTAEQFVAILHNENQYPLCNSNGCIQDITVKENTAIATYILPRIYSELPQRLVADPVVTSEKMRPDVLRDICREIQADFPDKSMKWMANYYSSDRKFLAFILITLSECPPK